jgi:hypothetical protein
MHKQTLNELQSRLLRVHEARLGVFRAYKSHKDNGTLDEEVIELMTDVLERTVISPAGATKYFLKVEMNEDSIESEAIYKEASRQVDLANMLYDWLNP